MYIIDDKNLDFYNRILHALNGRGVDCIPISDIEVNEKSKPVGTFIATVDKSFDCSKNQEFLTFLKKPDITSFKDFMPQNKLFFNLF